jgi:16S rRNA (cytidine1402-2'-O)-methyltransferase
MGRASHDPGSKSPAAAGAGDLKPLEQPGKSRDSSAPSLAANRGGLAAAPGLHVLATPIGNASDISLRALEVLRACDAIAAEDTRVTAKLLAIHGISRPLIAYNDHNAAGMRPKILARLAAGQAVVLVSDAGTPLVSDPGYKLVRAALAAGFRVEAVPGPSAVLTALTLSGLPSDRFLFAGFLPSRTGERARALCELAAVPATLIFFESAQRLAESLPAMADVLGERQAVVARELTKRHEEVRRGSLRELAAHYGGAGAPKGEVTLVVGPPLEEGPDFARIDAALAQALAFMPVKAAAEMIAALTGASRKQVYDRALEYRSNEHEDDEREDDAQA